MTNVGTHEDTTNAKSYIGDGVYVEFDGFALVLTTENGISVTNRIVLEPDVWAKLLAYHALGGLLK